MNQKNQNPIKNLEIISAVLIILIIILVMVVVRVYSLPLGTASTEKYVPWGEVIVNLRSGRVKSVTQTHNLDVFLKLKDGSTIRSRESRIDMIFDEIKRCGKSCEGIPLATE